MDNDEKELELKEEKADTQRRMAWLALISMFVVTGAMFLPIFPVNHIAALSDLFIYFYIAMAGIVAAFMGFTTWMTKR